MFRVLFKTDFSMSERCNCGFGKDTTYHFLNDGTYPSIVPFYQASKPSNPIIIMKDSLHNTDILQNQTLDYYLSEVKKQECHLFTFIPVLIIVIICNLCRALIMYKLCRDRNRQAAPLVTYGDAIGSLVEHPDHTTKGRCLVDKQMFEEGMWDKDLATRSYCSSKWFAFNVWPKN